MVNGIWSSAIRAGAGGRGARLGMLALAFALLGLAGCTDEARDAALTEVSAAAAPAAASAATTAAGAGGATEPRRAVFAAGCFWCVEQAFDEVDGVLETISGYTGGDVPEPTYREVTSGTTGHLEALEVRFDPARVSYEALLAVFWRNVDPTDDGGQFCDRGSSYQSAIFAVDDAQRDAAQRSLAALRADPSAPSPIVTPVRDLDVFYEAEEYHQDYHLRNPLRYRYYKTACGRSARLDRLWAS